MRSIACLVPACQVLSCLVLSCLGLSWLVLFYLILSCMYYLVMLCHIMFCHIIPGAVLTEPPGISDVTPPVPPVPISKGIVVLTPASNATAQRPLRDSKITLTLKISRSPNDFNAGVTSIGNNMLSTRAIQNNHTCPGPHRDDFSDISGITRRMSAHPAVLSGDSFFEYYY